MSADNPKNIDDHQLKELRVTLPKMNISDSQNQPSTSSQAEEEISTTSGEMAEKKHLESDGSKGQKKTKSPASSGDSKVKFRKTRIKPDPAESKEKESPKLTKRRSTSEEKKKKAESDNSGKQAKEKRSTSKGKAKDKNSPAHTSKEVPEFRGIKDLLRDDPTLPEGWKRIIKGKHVGTELKPVVCIASPEGRKFYFKARLKEYLEKNNSDLTIDDFYFGLYEKSEREKDKDKSETSAGSEGKKSKKKQKKTTGAAQDKEQDTKEAHLDSDASPKKGRASKGSKGTQDVEKSSESSGDDDYEAGDKNLLLEDPDLPEGWVRKVLVKNDAEGCNKIQVLLISPDGKKFRRKHLLQKYLQKTKSNLDINQFYFGIYPRKDEGETSPKVEEAKEPAQSGKSKRRRRRPKRDGAKQGQKEDDKPDEQAESPKKKLASPNLPKSDGDDEEPMRVDPNLPLGWRRYIKVRSAGESAGRMEVIIVSPDGKRFRSKGTLEHYLRQRGLNMKADEFDFTVYGKHSKKYSSPAASTSASSRKRGSASYASDAAGPSEDTETREGAMIDYVSGLMLTCGLTDLRTERKLRARKQEQEKVLKNYLDSLSPEDENEEDDEKCEISSAWVKKLALCRNDFGTLDDDAAETIAGLTKDFVARLAQSALKQSKDETSLEYNDIAEVVNSNESLAPLKSLIPKKITFKDYMKLNRPKKFTSFT